MILQNATVELYMETEQKQIRLTKEHMSQTEHPFHVAIQEQETKLGRIATLQVAIARVETWDTTGLRTDWPVYLQLYFDALPQQMTAMYLYSEWWTRPAFVADTTEIPDKTQVLFCKGEDGYTCILPMVGKEWKATICKSQSKDAIGLALECGTSGKRTLDEVIYLSADGKTLREAIWRVFQLLHESFGIPLREEADYPETLEYLGWCSWDAFYKEINDQKLREKAKEFAEKDLPVRWMIFDDGWMKAEDDMLCDLEPDPEKFQNGFETLISDIKEQTAVSWFGVWHAFGGYWAGINPKSELAYQEQNQLYETKNGRVVPGMSETGNFYQDWYDQLRKEGIDFVKVDGQSSMPIYFRGDMPYVQASRRMHQSLDVALQDLGGTVIHCMGMAMENMVSRQVRGVSRNSDDFVPNRENGFAEHLIQNSYNALYHNMLYHLDWDMFWTKHPDAMKHGLIRAMSGGPIYFSDRIGESDAQMVSKLCYLDGQILRPKRSATVTEDCVFIDPTKVGLLKLQNAVELCDGKKAGLLACFNLTAQPQEAMISLRDIPELPEDRNYILYDYIHGEVSAFRKDTKIPVQLDAGDYGYFYILPKENSLTPLGLVEKFVGILAIEQQGRCIDEYVFRCHEHGRFGWLCDDEIVAVQVDGKDVTDRVYRNGQAYIIDVSSEDQEMMIRIITTGEEKGIEL